MVERGKGVGLMGWQTCPSGHRWKSRFQAHPSELFCKECGEAAVPTLKAKTGGTGLSAAPESPILAEAHLRFTQLVTEWGCWARDNRLGHRCWGPLDPHHLAPASWIRQTYRDLPDDELAAILYAPILGCPACRLFHEGLENRSEVIYFEELDPELIEFAQKVDRRYPDRPSLLARLELESPRKAAA